MCHRLFIPLVFLALCGVSAGQEDVSALIHKLKDKDKKVRSGAAYALRDIGPAAKEAVPALIVALKDEDKEAMAHLSYAFLLEPGSQHPDYVQVSGGQCD